MATVSGLNFPLRPAKQKSPALRTKTLLHEPY